MTWYLVKHKDNFTFTIIIIIIIIIKTRQNFIIDVAISSDRNLIRKEAEKKLKYKNLSK
jgi:hypothetical protein